MEVKGKVVAVEIDVQVPKKDGTTYPGTILRYIDSNNKSADQSWHENAFKYNKPMLSTLKQLKVGDVITIVKEKKGEFWNVSEIKMGGEMSAAPASSSSSSGTVNKTSSTYETPEERGMRRALDKEKFDFEKSKQKLIIKQSSLSNAIDFLKMVPGEHNVDEVIETANIFYAYVLDDGV